MHNLIDKEDLITSAATLEDIFFIVEPLIDDFFEKYDPENNNDISLILYDFRKYRAFSNILYHSLKKIEKEFKDNGITAQRA